MTIAISRGTADDVKYKRYAEWVAAFDSSVQCIDLHALQQDDAMKALASCDGLILTGGPDVDPALYGKQERIAECTIDAPRDTREYAYLEYALSKNMPVLGVCRGMQLINVYFGGTLVVDIPTDIPGSIAHKNGKEDAVHLVQLTETSYLGVPTDSLAVKSFHHQSVADVADAFVITARSKDGVAEAMEPKDPAMKIACVQWHPERMAKGEPMSDTVMRRLLSFIDPSGR